MTDPFAPPPGDQPQQPPAPAPVYGAPVYGTPPPPPYGAPLYGMPLVVQPKNGMGTAALVLGILAIITSWSVVGGLGLGITGLVLGLIGRRRAKHHEATNGGVALAGAICSGIGVLGGVAMIAVVVLFVTSDTGQRFLDCLDAADGNSVATQQCEDRLKDDLTR